ncbi:MAG: DNA topoisomerase IV subunit A [Bacilli bacterium]|nr:DNA topoisomerase IV subunit A [Bacilli bacterium]
MAKKKKIEEVVIPENILIESMDELMGNRFGIYAKDVIQDRAIPDARDGMKPVQRRIIYAMWKTGNTIDKPTKKCAHIVGEVMGKYHPHGDSSIYEALVRMSQSWKIRLNLVDFQGNNGSEDGDGAAAYRYTEARLSALSNELVRDLNEDTVDMELTFDDTEFEPTVLPSRFPNLFLNGTEGIAVGMATNIPPHNLKEICDAVIHRIKHPNCPIESLLGFVQGPDFPTGGIMYRGQGLVDMYTTGKGRVEIASKCEIVENDGVQQIIVTEIPYGVIKREIVRQIDQIRHDKTIAGIDEVRDESDKSGTRIAIDLKEGAKADSILTYLMNKTDLKSSYSANMVAIVDGRPVTMTLATYCDTYIAHQKDVVTRKCKWELAKDSSRLSVVNGLIKAASIIDEVIHIIRNSADKADAKQKLEDTYDFTPDQSEAIVMMQLYKLSHTDIVTLENEKSALDAHIAELNKILGSEEELDNVIIGDLRAIVKKYGDERRTQISDDNTKDLKSIDKRDLVAQEEVMVAVTRDGYLKRSSIASWKGSKGDQGAYPGMKGGDTLIYSAKCLTTDFLLLFTIKGNFLYVPVHLLKANKWLDEGQHVSFAINLDSDDKIIRGFAVRDFREDLYVALVSNNAQIKRVRLSDFKVVRYNRPILAMKLLSSDYLADAVLTSGNSNLFLVTKDGQGVFYNENELEPTSTRSSGVKAGKFKGSEVAAMLAFYPDEKGKVLMVTDLGHTRVFDINNIALGERLGKTTTIFKSFKNEPHNLVYMVKLEKREAPISYKFTRTNGEYVDITFGDTYCTPMEKYAKKPDGVAVTKKDPIAFCNKADSERIDSTIKALEGPVKEVKETTSIFPKEPMTDEKEHPAFERDEVDEPSEKYEQISIFGDDF